MGETFGYKCRNCGFEAELGNQQPYFIMCGAVTDKYCTKTGYIISVITDSYDNSQQIICQNKEWQIEFGDPEYCRNCNCECLQDVELLTTSDGEFNGYKCPSCGSVLDEKCIISMSFVD